MKGRLSVGISISSILVLASILPLTQLSSIESAEAYQFLGCKHPSNTVKYRIQSGTSSSYVTAMHYAVVTWNDAPSGLFLDEVTSGEHIFLQTGSLGLFGPLGITNWGSSGTDPICHPTTGFLNAPKITLNIDRLNSAAFELGEAVAAHELGHAIGLAHTGPGGEQALMYATSINYDSYGVFAPTLDDIRGVTSTTLYGGGIAKTSQCIEHNSSGGDIVYTGTCGYPMTEKIITAGTHRAFASQTQNGQSMPSVGAVLMTVKVKPTTLYRFSLGIHSTNNVADSSNRMATIELDNNGIKASYVNTGGTVTTTTLWSGTPSTSTTYFLEVVAVKSTTGLTVAGLYAYQDNGGGQVEPTFLGSAKVNSGINWNTYSTMHFGTGVWTDSSSNPLSNYQVSEYYNRMRSYT